MTGASLASNVSFWTIEARVTASRIEKSIPRRAFPHLRREVPAKVGEHALDDLARADVERVTT